jgi:hypothetical protein
VNTYPRGSVIELAATFRDDQGNALDPTTVTFTTRDPNGNLATYQYPSATNISHNGTGVFVCTFVAGTTGQWYWRAQSTGIGQAADEGEFYVTGRL